jgi:IMP dehydrogenase
MRKCDRFFVLQSRLGIVVTYEEVRLKTMYSEVEPNSANVESRFSRRVPLKIPIVSAAMDTVTESRLAIALAKAGGLGVIHKNLSPDDQREEVRRVKFHLSGRIAKPISVQQGMTLAEIERMRTERDFSFYTFPVQDENGRLVGLLTENDFDFSENNSRKASEVMTRDLILADPETTVDEAFAKMRGAKKKVLPLVDTDGRLAGMYLWSDLKRIKSGSSGKFNVDSDGRLRVAIAVGVREDAFERVELMKSYVDAFVIDTAHGDSKNVIETVKELKRAFDIEVVAGNVSQGESAKRLADAGADGVRVGQGPGSICTTRIVAGVGCAQVSAVYFAAKALEGTDIPVCADGGIVHPGDIPIAIGAGASSVTLGKVLAATKEAPGDVVYNGGKPMKLYRGMGSLSAMADNKASRERYRETESVKDRMVPEGVESLVPYAGELETVIHQFVGGLRKGMGYTGAATIEELRLKADFDRSTGAGMKENHPHDVHIERDTSNYRRQ